MQKVQNLSQLYQHHLLDDSPAISMDGALDLSLPKKRSRDPSPPPMAAHQSHRMSRDLNTHLQLAIRGHTSSSTYIPPMKRVSPHDQYLYHDEEEEDGLEMERDSSPSSSHSGHSSNSQQASYNLQHFKKKFLRPNNPLKKKIIERYCKSIIFPPLFSPRFRNCFCFSFFVGVTRTRYTLYRHDIMCAMCITFSVYHTSHR